LDIYDMLNATYTLLLSIWLRGRVTRLFGHCMIKGSN
jgi:hypothetical protein